jgi:uncharacterized protein (DUF302 family)
VKVFWDNEGSRDLLPAIRVGEECCRRITGLLKFGADVGGGGAGGETGENYSGVNPGRVAVIQRRVEATMANGMVAKASGHSVDETVGKLTAMLQAKGVTLFAVVDHSGEAAKVGMKMPNTKLLIFGSPKAGTPLMLAAPSVAIDLPLKILVAEDAAGKVWISYNSPEYLKERHGLPEELVANIAVVEVLAGKAAE